MRIGLPKSFADLRGPDYPTHRRAGITKLKSGKIGNRDLFIYLYVWLEKYFSRVIIRKIRANLPIKFAKR